MRACVERAFGDLQALAAALPQGLLPALGQAGVTIIDRLGGGWDAGGLARWPDRIVKTEDVPPAAIVTRWLGGSVLADAPLTTRVPGADAVDGPVDQLIGDDAPL